MEKNTFHQIVKQYVSLTDTLTEQETLDASDVLNALVTRDQIADHIASEKKIDPLLVPQLADADEMLKALTEPISALQPVKAWRTSLNPPESAWWWHLTPPPEEELLGLFERYDWIWDTLNIVVLTVILALIVDVTPRFYRGGTDTTGAFAIVIQSVLAMLTAGGILTKTGSQALERVFENLKVPHKYWQEIRLVFAIFMLFVLILFRNVGLPFLANAVYHSRGQVLHQAGRLLEAQDNYQRALELNPSSSDITSMEVHYDLGRLYEDLQDFGQARTKYQVAVQGNFIPAYNRLGRLKILVDNKNDEAVLLLLNGLKLAKEDTALQGDEASLTRLLYEMQKNLGWARLNQTRYREAKAELELAIEIKNDDAAAHCLLAQAIDGLDQESGLENSAEALIEWQQCGQLANRLNPDEDGWIYQARLAQLRPAPDTITNTVVVENIDSQNLANQENDAADLPIPEENTGNHRLIAADGLLELKRLTWTEFSTVTVGTFLQSGDQLRPAEDTQATVLCDDLTIWSVPAGVSSGVNNGCIASENPILSTQDILTPTTMIELDESKPYIISPRATKILTTTPILRWNRIPGTVTYTVKLVGGEIDWQITTPRSSTTYTGEIPLQAGITYTLHVETNDGLQSHAVETATFGFSPLPLEEMDSILGQVTSIGLSGRAETLARIELYRIQGLTADALESTLALLEQEEQSTVTHRVLGDIYQQIGLPLLAEEQYQQAVVLAIQDDDLVNQALIQERLADVFLSLNIAGSAIHWLREAQTIYQQLGDIQQVERLEDRVKMLDSI